MFELAGKIALITGGLGGMGFAFTKELLRNGLKGVSLLDIDDTNAEKLLRELTDEFGSERVLFIKTDITKPNEIDDAFEATIKTFKNLDVVINCAGILNEIEWERLININYIAAYRIMRMAMDNYLPKYKTGEEGLIINVSSIAALDGCHTAAYSSSKAALTNLSRNFGVPEIYEECRVKILTICPGLTDTNIVRFAVAQDDYSQKRMLETIKNMTWQQPEDVAWMLTEVIRQGENGSIWVCENKEPPYEYKFPERTTFHPSSSKQ